MVQPIHRPHQWTQALHRERHRPVQQLLLLAPDVLQNPHNLQVDTQREKASDKGTSNGKSKAKGKGKN